MARLRNDLDTSINLKFGGVTYVVEPGVHEYEDMPAEAAKQFATNMHFINIPNNTEKYGKHEKYMEKDLTELTEEKKEKLSLLLRVKGKSKEWIDKFFGR